MVWLVAAFCITALLYASVGFGGGSTYSVLLAVAQVDYRVLPAIALACNILVVTGGTVRFARAGIMPWRKAWVLVLIAAPAAFLGGLTPVDETTFFVALGIALTCAGVLLLVPERKNVEPAGRSRVAGYLPVAAAPLGYLAGLVGIGGGIFLAPLLHLTRWDDGRAIAATASLFILVNSLSGLAGQIVKGGSDTVVDAAALGWPLMAAVVVGGQIGTLLAIRVLPLRGLRQITALLTIYVGFGLLRDHLPATG